MDHDIVKKAIENIRLKSEGGICLSNYPVTINFHPDRYTLQNEPILRAIANSGVLKSQFETGTSNGGLVAYPGGARWFWEQRVFDGAYDCAPNCLRPKYGALNFRGYETGASSRFGSAYFQLKDHVLERTTFCYPDSFFEPKDFGVVERLSRLIDKASLSIMDLLDDYIEAHIHGVISLKDDVQFLVLDPVYRSSVVEEHAVELNVPIKWHNGYELVIEKMNRYPEYRGQRFIDLAKKLAEEEKINPKHLGLAVTKLGYDEQDVKKMWHYLARFGYKSSAA